MYPKETEDDLALALLRDPDPRRGGVSGASVSADASHPLDDSLLIRTRPFLRTRAEAPPPQRLEDLPRLTDETYFSRCRITTTS